MVSYCVVAISFAIALEKDTCAIVLSQKTIETERNSLISFGDKCLRTKGPTNRLQHSIFVFFSVFERQLFCLAIDGNNEPNS